MKNESIFFSVTISFVISLLLLIASFTMIVQNKQSLDEEVLKKKYFPIIRKFLQEAKSQETNPTFAQTFKAMNFEVVKDRKIRSALLYNPKTEVLLQRELKSYLIRILNIDKINYIFIKNKKSPSSIDAFVLKDYNTEEQKSYLTYFLVFGIILALLIISYLTTLRKIYPLKILRQKIPHLAQENFDFECCDTTKKDEVSLLALEFKSAASKLGELKETRSIFLADLLSEINVAVVEGKELSKLNNSDENAAKMQKVFAQLDILIDDFASMKEMLLSNRKDIEINHFYLEEIIDKSLLRLDIDKSSIDIQTQNIKLLVSDILFSVAFRNLIDNAIKYSSDSKVLITTFEDDIIFENRGEKLPFELNTYFTPYLKEEDRINEHFGLGLYIVHNILKANGYTLEYEYCEGINKFKCAKNREEK